MSDRQHAGAYGPRNVNYNGGLAVDQQSGRGRIICRDGSTVYYYRAVVEAALRRELGPHEQVHHLNGDPSDDRLENLAVLDIREHGALHGRLAWAKRKSAWRHAWSGDHERCVSCGTTEQPHQAHGLCKRCDSRERARRRRARERVT